MRDRERVKFQKEIWAAIEGIVVGERARWYYRRGQTPLEGFKFTKKGDPKDWKAVDVTAPKGWELKLSVNGFSDQDRVMQFRIYAEAHYVKYGEAGAGFTTLKRFEILTDGSDLNDRIAELRGFIQRRRRRARHTAKKKGETDG